SMEVGIGEVCCVIGTNGAGKTTLFNVVAGQILPDQGHVHYKGQEITGLAPYAVVRRGIGRSFQCVNIFPRLTAFENVQAAVVSYRKKAYNFLGRRRGLFADQTEQILAEVGLADVGDSVSGALSYGYQKQLELGIALAFEPELLMLDEPTSGLSPSDSRHAIDLVTKVARERGTTLLIVEHDMAIVFAVASHIVVLHQGRVICDGSPDEVRGNEEVQRCYLGERV
ncbi:MAG TPA: ABC transporter ATP-binding protein, partial [Thermoleophilia bacterium]|nr:ABC transporter ATP-binding protein [Thermoleophilia bacterium]